MSAISFQQESLKTVLFISGQVVQTINLYRLQMSALVGGKIKTAFWLIADH
jgi:hypothetical protein